MIEGRFGQGSDSVPGMDVLRRRVIRRTRSSTEALLWCGTAAAPLFVGTFLLEGARRADYDPFRHPVSSLALGPRGWVQTVNFCTAGVLWLAGAVGLTRTDDQGGHTTSHHVGPILLAAAGVGMLGSGAFVTDPVSGYPPGTPDTLSSYSTAGALHDAFAVPTFLGLPAAAFVFARQFRRHGHRGWAAYSAASGAGMLAALEFANAAFGQRPALVRYGGGCSNGCRSSLGWPG